MGIETKVDIAVLSVTLGAILTGATILELLRKQKEPGNGWERN